MKTVLGGIYALIFLSAMFILFDSCEKKNDLQRQPVNKSYCTCYYPYGEPNSILRFSLFSHTYRQDD